MAGGSEGWGRKAGLEEELGSFPFFLPESELRRGEVVPIYASEIDRVNFLGAKGSRSFSCRAVSSMTKADPLD